MNYVLSATVDNTNYAVTFPTDLDEKFHTIKAGINYKFNWGAPVVARY